MIILLILSLIDIFAGVLLYLTGSNVSSSNIILLIVGVFVLGKGMWSLFSSFSVGNYLEWMGLIDLGGGLSLIFIFFNMFTIIYLFWWIILLKGVYSFSLSLIKG